MNDTTQAGDTTRIVLIALGVALIVIVVVPFFFMASMMSAMMGGMMGGGMMPAGAAWIMLALPLLVVALGAVLLVLGLRR
jgi:hypothetical protein